MSATIKIKPGVMGILQQCKVVDSQLFLPEVQLDRKIYTEVDKVLKAMGGKWNRNIKAHIFDSDPTELLLQAIITGEVTDQKKAFSFYPTPQFMAADMIRMAKIEPGMCILEPSAGHGHIVSELALHGYTHNCHVDICELRDGWGREVANKYDVCFTNADFLTFHPGQIYDRILANPPFDKQADIIHVDHMLDCLKPQGVLVSVMSAGIDFRVNKRVKDLLERLESECAWKLIQNEKGSFADSGTMVNTVLLYAKKY